MVPGHGVAVAAAAATGGEGEEAEEAEEHCVHALVLDPLVPLLVAASPLLSFAPFAVSQGLCV